MWWRELRGLARLEHDMTQDFSVDSDLIAAAKRTVRNELVSARAVVATDVNYSSVGGDFAHSLEEFHSMWHRECSTLSAYLTEYVTMLDDIEAAFDRMDEQLSRRGGPV
jgi:chitinase